MNVLQATALEKEINKQLLERAEGIMEELMNMCEYTDSMEKIYSKMIFNAVMISVKLSAGIMVDTLIGFGLVEPHDEDQLRRNIFHVME